MKILGALRRFFWGITREEALEYVRKFQHHHPMVCIRSVQRAAAKWTLSRADMLLINMPVKATRTLLAGAGVGIGGACSVEEAKLSWLLSSIGWFVAPAQLWWQNVEGFWFSHALVRAQQMDGPTYHLDIETTVCGTLDQTAAVLSRQDGVVFFTPARKAEMEHAAQTKKDIAYLKRIKADGTFERLKAAQEKETPG